MVGLLIAVAIGVAVFYFLVQNTRRNANRQNPSPAARRSIPTTNPIDEAQIGDANALLADIAFLKTQWAVADKEKESGALSKFPKWFFDPPTERQLERLKAEGMNVSGGDLRRTSGAGSP